MIKVSTSLQLSLVLNVLLLVSFLTTLKVNLGNFVLYDFAGQQEYFSSHEAVLEQMMGKPLLLEFVCLVDLSESKEQICESLHYWISFVDNACSTAESKSHMVIVGSHADQVTLEETKHKKLGATGDI